MKFFQNQFKNLYVFSLLSCLMFVASEAQAQGLQRAKTVLELIKAEILNIAPVVAVIALIGLGIGYAMNMVEKETFLRWAAGLVVVGSAVQITSMLLS